MSARRKMLGSKTALAIALALRPHLVYRFVNQGVNLGSVHCLGL
jgi:hypothetical protein